MKMSVVEAVLVLLLGRGPRPAPAPKPFDWYAVLVEFSGRDG